MKNELLFFVEQLKDKFKNYEAFTYEIKDGQSIKIQHNISSEIDEALKNKKFPRRLGVVEKRFCYKEHECICAFNRLGYRCGYVSTRFIGLSFTDYNIDCHGGLSFDGKPNYCYEPTYDYYLGFDCAHLDDKPDHLQAYNYCLINEETFKMRLKYSILEHGEIRTLEYVEKQCLHIVDQLLEQNL